jgi:zinc protease
MEATVMPFFQRAMSRQTSATGAVRLSLAAAFLIAVSLVIFRPAPSNAVEIQAVTSPGGITAWLVEDHSNPLISVSVSFRGGAALDPDGKEGLAEFVSGLLDEGAGSLDSQAFQGRLEDMSIRLGFNAAKDSFSGSLRTLTENREAAFYLMRQALMSPRFDDEPVERIRSQMLVRLDRDEENPDAIAGRTLNKILFPNHPYGRRSNGTREGLQSLARADLIAFTERRFARDNLVVGAVGDISPGELERLLDLAFGALPAKASPWDLPEVTVQAAGQTIVVPKEVPQSAILFAQSGPKRDDADFYVAYVVNHILGGGGFTSRLYEEAREKRGLVYGIGTGLITFNHAGMLYGSAGTQNARVSETLKVVRDEWQRMARGELSEFELADAKAYLTGSYAIRLTSSRRIASSLVAIQLDHLGIDYMDQRNAFLDAVSLDDAKRVAGAMLQPDALTVVVVGQPEGVESQSAQ